MRVGCYSLYLYCMATKEIGHKYDRQFGDGFGHFTGNTLRECLRKAKEFGWRTDNNRELCPEHNKLRGKVDERYRVAFR